MFKVEMEKKLHYLQAELRVESRKFTVRTHRPVFFKHVTTLKKGSTITVIKVKFTNRVLEYVGDCCYRGDAVGQVVLAGDAQQLVLRQLEAAEGTRSRLLLQLRRVRTSVNQMQVRVDERSEGKEEGNNRMCGLTGPWPRSSSCTLGRSRCGTPVSSAWRQS